DTCPGGSNTMGTGDLSWSPSGRRIVFSINDPNNDCKIFHTAADLSLRTAPQQFTWPDTTPDPDDYDPSWSPLGDQIFWVRNDRVVYRKGIPGIATDTAKIVVYDSQTVSGACCEAISPDGRTVAFSRNE